MDLAAENEELKRRLALAEEELRGHAAIGEAPPAVEQRYRTLFDAIDEGFCIIEVIGGERGEAIDYRFLQTNASFGRQTGLADAVGKRMRELAPDHEEHWFERYWRIAQTRTSERFEDRAEALGRWYDVYAFPIDDPHLRRVGILFRDVIERKRTEQELERSHHLLRTTFDSSLQILQLFKAVRDEWNAIVDFEWLLTNKQWNDRYGSNVGKRLLTENPAVLESGVWEKFLQVLETGVPITHEHFYAHEQFDGWFLQTIAKADDGILLSTLDITDRKRAEAALGESEKKYRSLFNTVSQGLTINQLVRDGSGRVTDARFLDLNPAYEAQTGFERARAIGRLASEIFPAIGPFWLEMAERVVETGQAERIERFVADTGSWFAFNMVPFEGTDQFVVLYENITDRKQAEAVLRENEERQAFLLKLSDALRPLADAGEIQATTARLLGAHLAVDRAMYAEVTGEPGAETGVIRGQFIRPAAPGRPAPALFPDHFTYESFGTDVMAKRYSGEGFAVADVNADAGFDAIECAAWARVGVRAAIVAPLVKSKRLVAELGVHSETSRTWTDAEISLVREAGERTWAAAERARAEAASRASEERFRQFAMASSAGLWIRDAATLDMEYVSPAIGTIYGLKPEDMLGRVEKWAAAILPEDRGTALNHLDEARQGHSVVHEFRIQRVGDRAFRWLRNTDFPLHDDGHIRRIGGIAEDVTEAKLALEHQSVLLAELQHRVRNIMAVVRSIAARTADRAETVSQYAELLAGRLLALARVQALLTRAANVTVDIGDIVRDEVSVRAQHEGQHELVGPKVALSPKAAEVLTLAVHELATNALKYGALSVADGKVTVRWDVIETRGAPWLSFDWTEKGAPDRPQSAADQPRRRGFGSELIEGRIPYELKGRGKLVIEPGGARCHLEFPLKEGASVLETGAPQLATVFEGALDMTGRADLSGHRILVIEDGYYLAMDLARALEGAGAEVIGPCSTEEDARAEIVRQQCDAAVVDINLGSGPSFKLAETLKDRRIPFVFVTGYDDDVVPSEFGQVERLQKPVQLRQIVSALVKLLTPSI